MPAATLYHKAADHLRTVLAQQPPGLASLYTSTSQSPPRLALNAFYRDHETVLRRLNCYAAFGEWWQHRAARRAIGQLSEAQCRDTGIDYFAIGRRKPSIEIPAGLMAKLMQMR